MRGDLGRKQVLSGQRVARASDAVKCKQHADRVHDHAGELHQQPDVLAVLDRIVIEVRPDAIDREISDKAGQEDRDQRERAER